MGLYFTGTNTGTRYEVGKDYKTGDGRILTAQSDGSFKKKGDFVGYTDNGKPIVDNSGAGAISPGSRGSREAEWYATGGDAAAYRAAGFSGSSQAPSKGSPTLTPGANAPDGALRVVPPRQMSAAITAANRGAFMGSGYNGPFQSAYLDLTRDDYAWSGEDLPSQDMKIAGYHLRANPRWSNGEVVEMLFGDNEVVSTLYSVFHVPAVIGYNLRLNADANGFDGGKGPIRALDRALQPDALADTFMGAVGKVRQAVEDDARVYNDLVDAYDLRDQLAEQEWNNRNSVRETTPATPNNFGDNLRGFSNWVNWQGGGW